MRPSSRGKPVGGLRLSPRHEPDRREDEARARRQQELLAGSGGRLERGHDGHLEDRSRSRRDEQWEQRRAQRARHDVPEPDRGAPAYDAAYGDRYHHEDDRYYDPRDREEDYSRFPAIRREFESAPPAPEPPRAATYDETIRPEDLLPPIPPSHVRGEAPPEAPISREKGAKTRYREDLQRQMAEKEAEKAAEKQRQRAGTVEPTSARDKVRILCSSPRWSCLTELTVLCSTATFGRAASS